MDESKKTLKIRIGAHVIFTPSRRELFHEITERTIKLQTPASHCLEILIEKKGEVVSQEELINIGWGDRRKLSVSSNTYYQCILHLRKSLNEMGLTDVIVTIPRFGLKFSNAIPFVVIDGKGEPVGHHIECTSTIVGSNTIHKKIADDFSDSIINGHPVKSNYFKSQFKTIIVALGMMVLYLIFSSQEKTFTDSVVPDNNEYVIIGDGHCKIYTSAKKPSSIEMESFMEY